LNGGLALPTAANADTRENMRSFSSAAPKVRNEAVVLLPLHEREEKNLSAERTKCRASRARVSFCFLGDLSLFISFIMCAFAKNYKWCE